MPRLYFHNKFAEEMFKKFELGHVFTRSEIKNLISQLEFNTASYIEQRKLVKELEYIHSKCIKPIETLQIDTQPTAGINPCLTWGLPKTP